MRWDAVRQQTTGARADGQAVWSWRPDAGAKFAKTLRGVLRVMVAKRARSPGRARSKPLKTIRAGRPGYSRLNLGVAAAFCCTRTMGASRCPAFPAPSRNPIAPSRNPRGRCRKAQGR